TAVGTGAWSASGLKPGNYLVCEVQKSGWTQSQPDPCSSPVCGAPVTGNPSGGGYAFSLTSNQSKTVGDLGNYRNASISGVKYEDSNANGTKDGSESGPGVSFSITVYNDKGTKGVLDAADTVAQTTTTAVGTGAYSVSNLKPGDYLVCETQKASWTQSQPDPSSSPVCGAPVTGNPSGGGYAFTLTSGQSKTVGDLGNYRNASISGVKYEDANANGTKCGWESGPAVSFSITVYNDKGTKGVLDAADTVAQTTTTAVGTGAYSVSNLKPGDYLVCETQKASWTQSQPDPSSSPVCGAPVTGNPSGGGYAFTLTSGQSKTVGDLDNYRNASISGVKYEDANANGTKDGSESGPGVSFSITVYNDKGTKGVLDAADTVAQTTTTAVGTGAYSVSNLKPGDYLVCETQKASWTQSQPDPSSSPVCGAPVTGNPSGGGYAFTLTS